MLQRLRLTFGRGEEVKYISHLDMMRLWERTLRRAALPVAYSQGFNPHPRISLAAPLAVGVTSEAELADIFLERRVTPYSFLRSASVQLPRGVSLSTVEEVGLSWPSLQSVVCYGEYRVRVKVDRGRSEVESAVHALLEAKHIPWEHMRDTGKRCYDLRPLVEDLRLLEWFGDECVLGMRLRAGSTATGRPEQVAAALGLSDYPMTIHRTRLILHGDSAVGG
ncbi:MAG: TIGR03936 family radical SAM-associated protein [Chloroflexota bacterium]